MKVKLLEPIDGYEEIAEWRQVVEGETFIGYDLKPRVAEFDCGTWNVLTPKPLPVVEPPQWLGCVKVMDNKRIGVVTRVDTCPAGVVCVMDCGSAWWRGIESIRLYPTANIPITPELAALFKEPHGCNTNNT
jgi:hypothetical protein